MTKAGPVYYPGSHQLACLHVQRTALPSTLHLEALWDTTGSIHNYIDTVGHYISFLE